MSEMVPAQGGSLMSFGQTRLDPGDIIMPRVKLLQAQSDEANGEDARGKPGEFFNTLTSVVYGKTLRFVPILPFKQRIFLVRDERRVLIDATLKAAGLDALPKEAGGLTCRSFDMQVGTGFPGIDCASCPLAQWDGDQPPHCSETYNVAAASEEGELIVLSFSKSSARVGRQLFSMIRLRPGAFGTIFEANSRVEKGSKGTYFVPMISPVEAAPPELVRQVRSWASQLEGVRLDVTPEDDEAVSAPSGSDPF